MKLFFEPEDAQSLERIKISLEKLRGYGADRLLSRMMPYIQERLGFWDEIVKDEFPDAVFSARTMLKQANSVGDVAYLLEPVVFNESLEDISWGLNFRVTTPMHTHNKDFSYAFLSISNAKKSVDGVDIVDLSQTGISISDRALIDFKKAGVLDRVDDLLKWTILDFGHDFGHAATEINFPVSSRHEIGKLTLALFEDERNSRSSSGSEEFALQLNQQIFLKARERNSSWFRRLLIRTEKIAEVAKEVNDKCSPEVGKNFTEMMAFFVSNYVPRNLLLNSEPQQWVEILKVAQPEVSSPSFWLGGDERFSIAELSLKYQQALLRDIASQRVAESSR